MKNDNKEPSAVDIIKIQLGQSELYQELLKRESKYIEIVDKIFKYAEATLPKINRVFANYTGHGIEHSMGVMKYMYDLVTKIADLSDLEITCLIYAALLHDIGMVANETEIEAIKNDELIYNQRKYSAVIDKYKKENIALQECIRPVHGARSYEHIMKMDKDYFIIPGYTNISFQEEIAKICQAHTTDHDWVLCNLNHEQVKGSDELNAQYLAMLLRVADYLDVDELRTPIELYRLVDPSGYGNDEWKQHLVIENKDKIVRNKDTQMGTVIIYGECDDSKIHRKLLFYFNDVSEELKWCTSYSQKNFKSNYHILLVHSIDNRIKPKGFEVSDLKLQMDYRAIMNLLMSEKLYDSKKHGLRELLQNSIDACKVMVEETKNIPKYHYNVYNPEIKIIIDSKNEKMIIMDNGTGMNHDILTKYFLNVGKSYYCSDDFLYQRKEYKPIGTFGIGFLACFMLSENVTVETRHYSEQQGFSIELEKGSEFVCKKVSTNFIGEHGTAIILNLKSVLQIFENKKNIEKYIKKTFLNQKVSIQIIEESHVNIIQLNELYTVLLETCIDKYNNLYDFLSISEQEKQPYMTEENHNIIDERIFSLDKYLNGISAYAFMNNKIISNYRKLSDLFNFSSEFKIDIDNLNLIDLDKFVIGDVLCVIYIKSKHKGAIYPIKFDNMDSLYRQNLKNGEIIKSLPADLICDFEWFDLDDPIFADHLGEIINQNCKIKELLNELIYIRLGFMEVSRFSDAYVSTKQLINFLLLEFDMSIYINNVYIMDIGIYGDDIIYPFYPLNDVDIIHQLNRTIAINIESNNIKPNISRSNLSHEDIEALNSSIVRAIIQYQIDNTHDIKKKNVFEIIAYEYSQNHEAKYFIDVHGK